MKFRQIRKAAPKITEAINSLLQQLSPGAKRLDYNRLKEILRQKNFILIGAWRSKQLIGIASIYFEDLLSGRAARIEDVVVDEKERGKGIGTMLTKVLIIAAKAKGAAEINLASRPEREAANVMYQKLGFVRRDTNAYRLKLNDLK